MLYLQTFKELIQNSQFYSEKLSDGLAVETQEEVKMSTTRLKNWVLKYGPALLEDFEELEGRYVKACKAGASKPTLDDYNEFVNNSNQRRK